MLDFLQTHSAALYFYEYFGAVLLLSLLECLTPRRVAAPNLKVRWSGNAGVLIISEVARRLVFPLAGYGFASVCVAHGWGLLNQVSLPLWFEIAVTLVALDLAVYVRHRLGHTFHVLWRLHRLHHSDDDVDFTTALRFHPLDVLYATAVDLGLIALLGAPPVALLIFQMVSTLVDFLAHANIRVPESIDRFCRQFVVTPYMHRIHHSREFDESNANYGNVLPFWDRWLGTYMKSPRAGYGEMRSGLPEFAEGKHQFLHMMLVHPFLRVESDGKSGIANLKRVS